MPVKAPAKRCGAKLKRGGRCGQVAGWGTDHRGSGRCKMHGGSSPSGRKSAAKEAALTFARGQLGAAMPGSPLDAMQEAVDLVRGLIAYYRHELATAAAKIGTAEEAKGRERIEMLRGSYEDAIRLEKDVAKASLDAGVAERRARLAELQAELFVGLILKATGEVFGDLLTPERQALLADVLSREFEVLEGEVLEEGPLGLPAAA
jgi:hypothetical protein